MMQRNINSDTQFYGFSDEFKDLVKHCNAEVVKNTKNDHIDSYVLR